MTGCENPACDEPADVPCQKWGNTYCFAHAGHPEHTGPDVHAHDDLR